MTLDSLGVTWEMMDGMMGWRLRVMALTSMIML